MIEYNTRKLMNKFMKAINVSDKSPVFGLSLRPEYSAYTKEKMELVCNFSEVKNAFVALQIYPPFRIIHAKDVEKRLIHTVTRTQWAGSSQLKFNRFSIDLANLPVEFIQRLLDYIFASTDPRTNYSWVAPLQEILFDKEVPVKIKSRSHQQVSFRDDGPGFPVADPDEDNYIPDEDPDEDDGLVNKGPHRHDHIKSKAVRMDIINRLIKNGNNSSFGAHGNPPTVYRRSDGQTMFFPTFDEYRLLKDHGVVKERVENKTPAVNFGAKTLAELKEISRKRLDEVEIKRPTPTAVTDAGTPLYEMWHDMDKAITYIRTSGTLFAGGMDSGSSEAVKAAPAPTITPT